MRRKSILAVSLSIAILLSAASVGAAVPRWKRELRNATRPSSMSIMVTKGRRVLWERRSSWHRIPASNQKLLLSMALLARLGPETRFRTKTWAEPKRPPLAHAGRPNIANGVLRSHLFVTGSGDPGLAQSGGGFVQSLSIKPTWIGDLAREIKRAGIRKIDGRVIGVRSRFSHDWYAPGWKDDFNDEQVALPSALTLNGNVWHGHFIDNPEFRFAKALTHTLEALGVKVRGAARSWDRRPSGLARVATVESRPLRTLLGHMNRTSSNFFAEVLGKALAVDYGRVPGTIAGGARSLRQWIRKRHVSIKAYDGSGLSFANRVSARGIVRLLRKSERQKWGKALFESLPKGGWGTLEGRLQDVRLRAKTGTLEGVSSLSGWLWLKRSERWARFSILSTGRPSWEAKAAEDKIVRLISRHL